MLLNPDVLVVRPVAYVTVTLPLDLPFGLIVSENLRAFVAGVADGVLYWQLAMSQGDQTLIMGLTAADYAEMISDANPPDGLSSLFTYAELKLNEDAAYLVVEGAIDGAAHLYAICSSYQRRSVGIGDPVAGCTLMARAQPLPGERMMA